MFGTPQDGDYIEVVPAYGRDYKNQAEVKAALLDGKDFQLTTTRQYIAIREMKAHNFRVIVRYGKLMKTADMSKVVSSFKG